jgi:hypothetical protein
MGIVFSWFHTRIKIQHEGMFLNPLFNSNQKPTIKMKTEIKLADLIAFRPEYSMPMPYCLLRIR